MYKSILALSEGGPDAAACFQLAARFAGMFGGTVDAVHYAESRLGDFDIAAQSLPFVREQFEGRVKSHAAESERAFKEHLASISGATLSSGRDMNRERLLGFGRAADLIVVGRPGGDDDNISPETVRAVLYECARPVIVTPPNLPVGAIGSAVVAWNGSLQSVRALSFAMPFLEKARKVTVLTPGGRANEADRTLLLRTLARHGINANLDALPDANLSARGRGRALRNYARDRGADFLAMGAYGHGGLSNLLGLGGATAKVISSCPVPLLWAH
jgi:nucleotide-binding universal stress UspA family protein